MGLMHPRKNSDSANDSVNLSAFAARSAGTRVVAFAVCFAAAASVFRNSGAAFSATFVFASGYSTVRDGSIAYAAIHVDAANATDITS